MKKIIFAIFLILTILSCNDDKHKTIRNVKHTAGFSDTLQNINRVLVKKDKEHIEAYIKRMEMDMQESNTGLWYKLVEVNKGEKIKDGTCAKLALIVELLDGTVVKDSKISGTESLVVGKTDSESGLQEGLKMLSKGDSAVFITPPYLAKGLLGDFNKIPARSILVYKVKVLDTENF